MEEEKQTKALLIKIVGEKELGIALSDTEPEGDEHRLVAFNKIKTDKGIEKAAKYNLALLIMHSQVKHFFLMFQVLNP